MTKDPADLNDDIDYSKIRKHIRYKVTTPCRIINLETKLETESYLTSISVAGVSFVFKEILPIGTILRIEFDLPNGNKVNKNVEVRRFEKDLGEFPISSELTLQGFEHGSRFIVANQHVEATNNEEIQEEPVLIKEEVFKTGQHHLEFYRNKGNTLRHGFVTKYSNLHLFFSSLCELSLNEILAVNFIISEEERYSQEFFSLKILEINREGKLYSYKGVNIS
jgi:hypothetical protein